MPADTAPPAADRRVVIVGASVAGVRCATALRSAGFDGRIVLLDAESETPYDKPQLSKKLHVEHELERLVEIDALRERGVEFRGGVAATGLDLEAREVQTTEGPVPFDDLVIATGSRPRALATPLPARAGFVRTGDDWRRLREAVQRGGHLVVVGAGFLGMEAAAAARQQGMTVTVVDVAPRVLTRGIAPSAAEFVAERHLAEGVTFRLGAVDPVLEGDDRRVWVDGVEGDYALVSVGALPNVEWLEGSGLTLGNGVVCDANLSAAPGVWAVGDVARWPNARHGEVERHEHWTTAVRHARHVASSIASGSSTPLGELAYVWSDQYDLKIQAAGRVGVEEIPLDLPRGQAVLGVTDGMVTGVTSVGAPAVSVRSRKLLQDADRPVGEFLDAIGVPARTSVG